MQTAAAQTSAPWHYLNLFNYTIYTAELQWLERLWEHGIFFLEMGSLSHWGLTIAPGQEANWVI